jgi:hypothetical protein
MKPPAALVLILVLCALAFSVGYIATNRIIACNHKRAPNE